MRAPVRTPPRPKETEEPAGREAEAAARWTMVDRSAARAAGPWAARLEESAVRREVRTRRRRAVSWRVPFVRVNTHTLLFAGKGRARTVCDLGESSPPARAS